MSRFTRTFDLRLTVVGRGPARPQSDTPASGLLVEHGRAILLLDAGQGTIARVCRTRDPLSFDAIVISHLHADHSVDLAALRYMVPWAGAAGRRLPIWLPPGGREGLTRLAVAISERPSFFEDGFDLHEYTRDGSIEIAGLRLRFFAGRHYVPSCGVVIDSPEGARLAYTADTGPSKAVTEAVRDADLIVAEATLRSAAEDEVERGHMTASEALELAAAAQARSVLLTHFDSGRRSELIARARASRLPAYVAEPDLTGVVVPGEGYSRTAGAGDRILPGGSVVGEHDTDVLAAGHRIRVARR
jgi:ribonuclease BN (tRNA processing enzyme)